MTELDASSPVGAANDEISRFLENAPSFSPSENTTTVSLSGLEEQITGLMLTIHDVVQYVNASPLASLDTNGRAEIDRYARNLHRLKHFLTFVGSYAETRRDQLLAQSRKVSQVLAWCDAVKLANRE
jgi:hypothetical protein